MNWLRDAALWIKIGTGLAVLGAVFWWHQTQVSNAYASGQTSERLVWQERQVRADIEADLARKNTQVLIKAVEADYWQKQAASEVQHRDQLTALEQTLTEEKADDEKKPAVAGCPAFVSKRVRDQLNAIGRDPAPGDNP
jgi:hypothetical protein